MNSFVEKIVALPTEKRSLLVSQLPPMSFAQQRLWFLSQLEPESPFYNGSAAIRVKGLLNVAALERTLNEVVRRHHVLRTAFITLEDQPVQIVSPYAQQPLAVTDLSAMSEAEREAKARRIATEEALLPFDLSTDLLLRSELLRLSETEHI